MIFNNLIQSIKHIFSGSSEAASNSGNTPQLDSYVAQTNPQQAPVAAPVSAAIVAPASLEPPSFEATLACAREHMIGGKRGIAAPPELSHHFFKELGFMLPSLRKTLHPTQHDLPHDELKNVLSLNLQSIISLAHHTHLLSGQLSAKLDVFISTHHQLVKIEAHDSEGIGRAIAELDYALNDLLKEINLSIRGMTPSVIAHLQRYKIGGPADRLVEILENHLDLDLIARVMSRDETIYKNLINNKISNAAVEHCRMHVCMLLIERILGDELLEDSDLNHCMTKMRDLWIDDSVLNFVRMFLLEEGMEETLSRDAVIEQIAKAWATRLEELPLHASLLLPAHIPSATETRSMFVEFERTKPAGFDVKLYSSHLTEPVFVRDMQRDIWTGAEGIKHMRLLVEPQVMYSHNPSSQLMTDQTDILELDILRLLQMHELPETVENRSLWDIVADYYKDKLGHDDFRMALRQYMYDPHGYQEDFNLGLHS